MFIRSDTFEMGAAIPARCAYGRIGPEGTVDSDNLNPDLAWGDAPAGTKSFAILCIDDDVPTVFDGRDASGALPAMQPRRRFVHWVQADVPATVTHIAEGAPRRRSAARRLRNGLRWSVPAVLRCEVALLSLYCGCARPGNAVAA